MIGGRPICIKIDQNKRASLFQGNIFALKSKESLEESKIKAVLSLVPFEVWEKLKSEGVLPVLCSHKVLDCYDDPSFQISKHFEEAFAFISENLSKGNNTLVHCEAGVSRSSAITIAYFMKREKLSFNKAEKRLEQSYAHKRLNGGFRQQLIDYQDVLFPRIYKT